MPVFRAARLQGINRRSPLGTIAPATKATPMATRPREFRSTKFDRPSYNDSQQYKTALRCIHRSVHCRFLIRMAPSWRNSEGTRSGIAAGARKSASRFSESLPLGCPGRSHHDLHVHNDLRARLCCRRCPCGSWSGHHVRHYLHGC